MRTFLFIIGCVLLWIGGFLTGRKYPETKAASVEYHSPCDTIYVYPSNGGDTIVYRNDVLRFKMYKVTLTGE